MALMSRNDTTATPTRRPPRYHTVLLAAFLRGATVNQAAAAAGISKSQTMRWKRNFAFELEDARQNLLDAAQSQLREALPATAEIVARGARDVGAASPVALQALQALLSDPGTDPALRARVAQAILAEARAGAELAFTIHAKLTEAHDLEVRLFGLEEKLAALIAHRTAKPPWPSRSLLAATPRPPAESPNGMTAAESS